VWRYADLRTIIYTSDYLNLTSFTPQELRRGMAKLAAAGYVQEKRGRFGLTRAGRDLVSWRGSKSSREDAYHVLKRLEAQLSASDGPTNAPDFEDPDWSYPGITDEAVSHARTG